MRNPEQAPRVEYAEFTERGYLSLLDAAAERYQFSPFGIVPADGQVLWRHDIDMSPHRALRIAQLESDRGIHATYFVLLHSPFYNALERAVVDCLRGIARQGHWIGLHFELGLNRTTTPEAELVRGLTNERAILVDLVGESVDAFSFHNPGVNDASQFEAQKYAGMVNAYSRDMRREYRYVSDSNGYWRSEPLADVLRAAPPRLQVLTHPEWWVPEPMSPRARVVRAVEGRAGRVLADYDESLAQQGRANIR
jgi:peptidoglycan/xylan/chitin deacetylase (PgdA/CDA1 family)